MLRALLALCREEREEFGWLAAVLVFKANGVRDDDIVRFRSELHLARLTGGTAALLYVKLEDWAIEDGFAFPSQLLSSLCRLSTLDLKSVGELRSAVAAASAAVQRRLERPGDTRVGVSLSTMEGWGKEAAQWDYLRGPGEGLPETRGARGRRLVSYSPHVLLRRISPEILRLAEPGDSRIWKAYEEASTILKGTPSTLSSLQGSGAEHPDVTRRLNVLIPAVPVLEIEWVGPPEEAANED